MQVAYCIETPAVLLWLEEGSRLFQIFRDRQEIEDRGPWVGEAWTAGGTERSFGRCNEGVATKAESVS